MLAVPAPAPVTTPADTVATVLLLVPHVPPVVVELNVILLPTHATEGPVRAAGGAV
jgi:hypothetical protein